MATCESIATRRLGYVERLTKAIGEDVMPPRRYSIPHATEFNEAASLGTIADLFDPPPIAAELLPRSQTTNAAE